MKHSMMENDLHSTSGESQSEDDEDGWKLTEEVEKEFYKTLSQIKNKDPKIYKKNVEFFKDVKIPEEKKSKKEKALTLRDYERKLIVEKGGELSDEEPEQKLRTYKEPTYVEEQESIKNSLKAALNSDSEDESDGWGGLLRKRENTEEDKMQEEENYKVWLKDQKVDAPDEEVKEQMKPLQEYWTNPELDQEEQFLRDYVLNKKYLEHEEEGDTIDLEVLDDAPDKSQDKCIHRFEEQDQEFIKRYPRNMENSVRRKKDHRKQKRDEIKERKVKEKEKKMVEIKLKKKLKKKQIEEKLEELKKLTGNEQLAFESVLEKDFDLDEHDKAMQRLFNEEFYSKDDPSFAPGGSTVEQETWNDDWYGEEPEESVYNSEEINCEDPNFNMDCDYDPSQHNPTEKVSRSRRRKDKHKRTTVSEALNKEKPLFDPATHKSFQEYVDQYYSIDCEDFIGDLPCRFKYRRTVPNSYGLTIEEILAADDKELERWCSIKRLRQLRPENKERGDVKVYKKKASDEALKRKILPSLFKKPEEDKKIEESPKKENTETKKASKNINKTEESENIGNKVNALKAKDTTDTNKTSNQTESSISESTNKKKKKKKKKKNKNKSNLIAANKIDNDDHNNKTIINRKRKLEDKETVETKKKKKNQNNNSNSKLQSKNNNRGTKTSKFPDKAKNSSSIVEMTDARLLAYGIKPKKFRNKLKYSKS